MFGLAHDDCARFVKFPDDHRVFREEHDPQILLIRPLFLCPECQRDLLRISESPGAAEFHWCFGYRARALPTDNLPFCRFCPLQRLFRADRDERVHPVVQTPIRSSVASTSSTGETSLDLINEAAFASVSCFSSASFIRHRKGAR